MSWTTFRARMMTRRVQFVLDVIILVAAFALAYLFRFDFEVPRPIALDALTQLPYVLLIQVGALALAGVYSFIWRYVGMNEVKAFVLAALWSSLAIAVIRLTLPGNLAGWKVPLSVTLMGTILAFGGVLGLRLARRMLYERFEKQRRAALSPAQEKSSVLLVGAGAAGVLAAREISGRGDTELEVRGFVDDDPEKQGAVIQGLRVIGRTDELPRLVRELEIDQVIITIAQISRRDMLRLLGICRAIPVKVRITPGLYEIIDGRVHHTRIRNVEIEDLLGRAPIYLEEREISRFVAGRTVLVTGAGGSIGSELVRQVARFNPARLLLVDRAEFALFDIDMEIRTRHPELLVHALVADVGDVERMRAIFEEHRPHVVLHAAAHKHVPMMEANPSEAIKNNILGTRCVAELAAGHGASAFVLISTDKAVNPTSVMGASKRVAELVVQDLARRYPTRFVAVRFGNVMGSAGSVIPLFREQIRRGGPVQVTHADMKRYFMTIPEASQLVLQAGAMGQGGEIFILDMGEPVRILDLALEMIRLTGLKPYEEMGIEFTGLRPGEKLFEELEISGEDITRTRHPKILIGKIAPLPSDEIRAGISQLKALAEMGDVAAVRNALQALVPEARLAEVARSRPRRVTGG
jgi:FlaA1/EpsC-like NDP-sugar epimerase